MMSFFFSEMPGGGFNAAACAENGRRHLARRKTQKTFGGGGFNPPKPRKTFGGGSFNPPKTQKTFGGGF